MSARRSDSLPPVYNPSKHKICASPITRYVGPRSLFEYGSLLSAYAMPLFSCSTAWNRSFHWHWWSSAQQLARRREISTARWLHENFFVPFLHIQSSLEKALVEKPMFAQVGSFCSWNLLSGTALQQDFVNLKVGSKHLMMNILAVARFA